MRDRIFPGTSYQYAHHAWGEFEGEFGLYGFVKGGIGGVHRRSRAARSITGPRSGRAPRSRDPRARRAVPPAWCSRAATRSRAHRHLERRPQGDAALAARAEVAAGRVRRARRAVRRAGLDGRIHLACDAPPLYTAFGSRGVGPEHHGHQLLGADVGRFEEGWRAQADGELPGALRDRARHAVGARPERRPRREAHRDARRPEPPLRPARRMGRSQGRVRRPRARGARHATRRTCPAR